FDPDAHECDRALISRVGLIARAANFRMSRFDTRATACDRARDAVKASRPGDALAITVRTAESGGPPRLKDDRCDGTRAHLPIFDRAGGA
ncbi:hypothetical protein AB4084_00615, partial [Lysobacter sp. 2RAB21]